MLPLVAQIPPPPIDGFSIGPLDVRFYGLLIAIGAYLGLRLAVRRYERYGGQPEVAERVALWSLGAGVVGARIGYVIPRFFENPSGTPFIEDPLAIVAIWEGGLAYFGGLFLGGVVGIVLVRRWGGDIPSMADAAAPAIPLAQAIGRWGNYFNQELYGSPTDVPWALEVDPGRRRPGFEGEDTFHPTFLYESIGNLVLIAVLLRIERTGRLRRGALLWCYAIGYGLIRGVVESLRVDTDARYLGLSRNNWIAIATVLVGIAGLTWWQVYAASREARNADGADTTGDGATDADTADEDATDGDATFGDAAGPGGTSDEEVVDAEPVGGEDGVSRTDAPDEGEGASVADDGGVPDLFASEGDGDGAAVDDGPRGAP